MVPCITTVTRLNIFQILKSQATLTFRYKGFLCLWGTSLSVTGFSFWLVEYITPQAAKYIRYIFSISYAAIGPIIARIQQRKAAGYPEPTRRGYSIWANKTCVVIIWSSWHGLTHWGRVTQICVSDLTSIGSDNGLSPGRRQAIIRTNAVILLIRPLRTNFSEYLSKF